MASPGTRRHPSHRISHSGSAACPPTRYLCEAAARRDPRGIRLDSRRWAIFNRGGFPKNIPRIFPALLGCDIDLARSRFPTGFRLAVRRAGRCPPRKRDAAHLQLRHWLIVVRRLCGVAGCAAALRAAGEAPCRSSGGWSRGSGPQVAYRGGGVGAGGGQAARGGAQWALGGGVGGSGGGGGGRRCGGGVGGRGGAGGGGCDLLHL